ncbi:hypothetical protein THAOC_35759 [Thalassiosira oceanica]|uniref:Uncharacterized protein n=1 Tax=Thalassiosira oceanica TaxID=159749 RepID=K0R0E4_THAOC|nr:hypothetical protein THAOC_35759 [Thalassiosira oceanica]|eukprot:EJK45618.1 hypothetical protein THAOC_35759 [Thalassiosira oceanica]
MKLIALVLASLSFATASDSIRLRGSGGEFITVYDIDEEVRSSDSEDDDTCAVSIRCLDHEQTIHETGARNKQELKNLKPCQTFCPWEGSAGSWKCTWGFSGYCPNDSSSSSSSGGRRPRGAGSPGRQCRKRVAETGAKTCIFPSDLIRDFGLVGGCSECGGLAAYQCVGDMPGVCCPPAAATRDTQQIVSKNGSENTCTRVDAEEDIGVLAEKM